MRGRKEGRLVVGIALSSRGFGYALLEGSETLVDWGAKTLKEDKNAKCIRHIEKLLQFYAPDILVTEDCFVKDSRRAQRIRQLTEHVIGLAGKRDIRIMKVSRKKLLRVFIANGKGPKHELARTVARLFPEELKHFLPPKRRLWMSEDYKMAIFDAVALAFMANSPPLE